MNSLIQLKQTTSVFIVAFGLACSGFLPRTQAVVPAPDGGYPGGNTAEGQSALLRLSNGGYNTAVGFLSLASDMTNSFNTAIGAGALLANTADQNTAAGAGALLSNTTGSGNTANGAFALFLSASGVNNTAIGVGALENNTQSYNSGIGASALSSNTTGFQNTAVGESALLSNIDADGNTALGVSALRLNTHGVHNTATGTFALFNNITGVENTAVGFDALFNNTNSYNTGTGFQALFSNTDGTYNTANGYQALASNTTGIANNAVGSTALVFNTRGRYNTAIGDAAGYNATTGDHNVYIGAGMYGVAGESNACYIASVYGQSIDPVTATTVAVDANNKLGTMPSARRFKKDIKPMDDASNALLALKPVIFHYKSDKNNTPCFGLIAEEVVKVNPALATLGKDGKPYSVRYDQINVMLLNEFLKEHKAFVAEQGKVQEQGATIVGLQQQIEALTAGFEKMRAQLELNKKAPQTVLNAQ